MGKVTVDMPNRPEGEEVHVTLPSGRTVPAINGGTVEIGDLEEDAFFPPLPAAEAEEAVTGGGDDDDNSDDETGDVE